jgi:hypothetical protein
VLVFDQEGLVLFLFCSMKKACTCKKISVSLCSEILYEKMSAIFLNVSSDIFLGWSRNINSFLGATWSRNISYVPRLRCPCSLMFIKIYSSVMFFGWVPRPLTYVPRFLTEEHLSVSCSAVGPSSELRHSILFLISL